MSHNRIIVLEDEEIALVVPEISDLEVITRGINHLDNAKYIVPDLPYGVMGYKAEEDFLNEIISKPQKHSFMIMLKNIEWTPIVGSLGLHNVSVFNRNAIFGILLYGENTGKWIGTRAIKLLLEYAFRYIHLHKVSLRVRGDNARAIACYKSCGFQECGRQREEVWIGDRYEDDVSMEILRSEWQQLSK